MPIILKCIFLKKSKNSFLTGLKYFSFPQNPILRKIWVERTSRPNLFEQNKYPRICERHFVKEDYLPDNISRTNGKVVTKRLNKKCAIPSRNLSRKFAPVVITAVKPSSRADQAEQLFGRAAAQRCSLCCRGRVTRESWDHSRSPST